MNPRLLVPVLLALPLLACSGKGDDTGGGGGGNGGSDDTGTPTESFNPSVTVVNSVSCEEYQSAGESWAVEITVDDPQGADTVTDGTVAVLSEDGGEMASYALACGNGECFGSFRADYDGIGCSLMGSVTLQFVVVDLNGNSSEPFDYATQ